MPASLSEEKILKQARFVLKGTVKKLKASNVAEVNKKEKASTVIVTVDEVIHAPESLGDYTGQDITVKLSKGENVKVGQRAVFYTNAWIFSENLAVESLGHRDLERSALALGASLRDPVTNLANQQLKERLETADVVVTGRVKSIRIPEDEKTPRRARGARLSAAAAAPETRRPISEHEPHWREAVVEVADVEKGPHKKKDIVIRFPESDDVRWYKAPKFRPGQEGVFILHKTQQSRPARARGIAATLTNDEADTAEAYTALHPADFQPLNQHPEIHTLIKGANVSDKKPGGSGNS